MKRISIAVLGMAVASFAADNLAMWSKFKNITVNTKASGANVSTKVSKFPVLIRLDSVNAPDVFSGASANGADIRLANTAGEAKPFEIEYWNSATKQAAIWVLADSVKGADSTASLRLYWGRPDVTTGSGTGVFEASNGYVGAWHFGNGTGDVRPASVTGAPAAFINNGAGATKIPGIIGLADTLRHTSTTATGSEEATSGTWIDLTRNANGSALGSAYTGYSDFTGGFSYSLWARPQDSTAFWRMLVLAPDDATSGTDRLLVMGAATNGRSVGVRWSAGCGYVDPPTSNPCNIANAIQPNVWNHVFVTKTPGSSPIQVFVNGAFIGQSSSVAAATVADRNIAWIGRAGDNNPYFNGKIDNATLAKVSRDSNFIKLSYQTQKAGANAVVLGSTQTQTVTPVAISALAYSAKAGADTLNLLTGTAFTVSPSFTGGPVDSFKVVGSALPAGLALSKANGVISGTPTAVVAAANYTIRAYGHAATGDSVSRTVRIATFAPASLAYTPDSIDVNVNTAFPTTNATYAGAPATFTVSPALPAGLSLNASTGAITGTPTAAAARASYTVKAKTAIDSTTKVLRIRVIDPTSINGGNGMLASGFSARSSSQGILFRMPVETGDKAVLSLVDMWGRTVYSGAFQAGALNWNGKNAKGQSVGSGIYVARVKILDVQGRLRKVNDHKVAFTR